MRLPAAFWALLGIGKSGAIVEPGDADRIVPALMQPTIEMAAPLPSLVAPEPFTGLSWVGGVTRSVVGALAGAADDEASTFSAGLWAVRGGITWSFTGTVNAASRVQLLLVDPSGNASTLRSIWLNSSPLQLVYPFEFVWHFIANGWFFRTIFPTTVAGDTLRLDYTFVANRLI